MPRPTGSKNKSKNRIVINFADDIAAKNNDRDSISAEIKTIEENIATLKESLKEKKAALKAVDKEIAKLEKQQAVYEAAQAEAAKRSELDSVLNKLLADGMSASEILEKLK